MTRIILNEKSFIAYVEYSEKEKQLFLTLRAGRQYLYSKFCKTAFLNLQSANNKGNYIANEIMKKRKDSVTFVGIVPMAHIEQITLPHTKYYLNHLAR